MTDREKFEQEWQKVMGTPASVLESMRVGDKYKNTTHDFLNAAYAIWQAALASQQPADDSRNEMLSMPDMVTAQDMRETLNILLHEEEAEAAATGFNQCLMECAPIYEAYIRRSRCIDELVKELDGMQESLNAKHRSFVAERNRADMAEKKLAALASQQPVDDGGEKAAMIAGGKWVTAREGDPMCEVSRFMGLCATPEIENDGWIEWAGGECPVSGEKLVEIKMRNGGTDGPRKAGNLSWHNGNTVRDEMGCDIIAYRVVKP